ncbi:MAG: hypothetical protein ACK53Y_25170, partial [bacterium]
SSLCLERGEASHTAAYSQSLFSITLVRPLQFKRSLKSCLLAWSKKHRGHLAGPSRRYHSTGVVFRCVSLVSRHFRERMRLARGLTILIKYAHVHGTYYY